jgi:hypothetical protein
MGGDGKKRADTNVVAGIDYMLVKACDTRK